MAATVNEATAAVEAAEARLWELQEQVRRGYPRLAEIPRGSVPTNSPQLKPTDNGTTATANKAERKFKWSTSLDDAPKFNFVTAVPRKDLLNIPWPTVKVLEKSNSGAGGVFFVQLEDGVVVIKPSRSLAPEVFASFVASRLGVYTPPFRLVRMVGAEADLMLTHLRAADPTWSILYNMFDMAYNMVMAYIAHAVALNALRASPLPVRTHLSGDTLRQMGRLLAMDVLLNNGDRLPCPVWDNLGNPGNVMLCDAVVIAIDSQITAINGNEHPEMVQEYLERVRAMIADVVSDDPIRQLAPFGQLAKLLHTYGGLDVQDSDCIELRVGFLEIVELLKSQGTALLSEFAHWRAALEAFDPPLVGLASVDLGFLERVLGAFSL